MHGADQPRPGLTNIRHVRYNPSRVGSAHTTGGLPTRRPNHLIEVKMNETDDRPSPDSQRLDHFVKLVSEAGTGGQAKLLIQAGEVKVNGEVETRRRRKLTAGDVVEIAGNRHQVE